MPINQIDINEFRGIKKCDGPIKLSKFVVLIGRNNSGKSSVLEALSLFPFIKDLTLPSNTNRLDEITKRHYHFWSLFYKYSGKATIDLLVKDTSIRLILQDKEPTSDMEVGGFSWLKDNKQFSKNLEDTFNVKDQMKRAYWTIYIPNDLSFLNTIETNIEQNLIFKNTLIKKGAHLQIVKEIVNKCVDDEYSELIFNPEIHGRKETFDKVPYYIQVKDLGLGISRIVLISLWLQLFEPHLVLLDDFETSLHPSLIKEFLRWLLLKDWQVILSTHSVDVLNALLTISEDISDELDASEINIIQLKKGKDDILQHKTLSIGDLRSLFDANQDPRLLVDLLKL